MCFCVTQRVEKPGIPTLMCYGRCIEVLRHTGESEKKGKCYLITQRLSVRAKLLWYSGTSKWLRVQRMCHWAPYKWSGRQTGFHWDFRNQGPLLLAWGARQSQHCSYPEIWSKTSAGSLGTWCGHWLTIQANPHMSTMVCLWASVVKLNSLKDCAE